VPPVTKLTFVRYQAVKELYCCRRLAVNGGTIQSIGP